MTIKEHCLKTSSHYYPNMDIVRYVLAFAVVVAHIYYLTGFYLPFPLSSYEGVGGFFALSGFLMYPSFLKHCRLGKYIKSRAKRILPQYLIIVFLCAFGFVFISSYQATEYFESSSFWKYLISNVCFLNWLMPDLPGVFTGDKFVVSAVNGSLWTMKVEWCLYISVPIFVWLLPKLKIEASKMALIIIILSICYRIVFHYLYDETGNEIYNILGRQIFGQLSYFYAGMLVYFCIEWFKRYLSIILIGSFCLIIFPKDLTWCEYIFSPFVITAFVLSLSLFPKDIRYFRHKDNISYTIYLIHWPVIQMCVTLGITNFGSVLTYLSSILATVVLSVIVEKIVRKFLFSGKLVVRT